MFPAQSISARIADIFRVEPVTLGAIPDAGIAACLVFPAAECVLSPVPLRHVACFALIRLDDATIWLLRTRGAAWSPMRLVAAAQTIRTQRGPWQDTEYVTGRLSYELEISSVAMPAAVLDRFDPEAWELRRTAVALVMRSLRTHRGTVEASALAGITRVIEEALHTTLGAAFTEFSSGTDAEALLAAVDPRSRVDVLRYNFLVQSPSRAWRLQLARTFPLFVYSAATGRKGSAGETIRDAVDAGVPLVRHLAARWGVSIGTIRSLLHKPAALVGEHWEQNVRGLAKLLDALRPDDRPKGDRADWQRFNRAVTTAEGIFRSPAWTSVLAQMWLREVGRRGWADFGVEDSEGWWGPDAIALVQRFRDGLARYLELEVARRTIAVSTAPVHGFEAVVDRYVSTRKPRRLYAIAESFDWHHQHLRAELVAQSDYLRGERFWPLLAADLGSEDKTRVVVSLTSSTALNEHGAAMNNCLEETQLADYVADCAEAKCFILGLMEGTTGAPLSTAEIRLRRAARSGRLEPRVVQHYGGSNEPPAPRCRQALAEVLAMVRSAAGQQHLETGLLVVRQRALLGNTKADAEAERLRLAEALGEALRPSLLEGMLAALLGASPDDGASTARDAIAPVVGDEERR